ncbi:hypothetical protein ACFQOY_13430 [Enterococcus alcedinis]|uniref:Uncharacterized protein n=1 Tax=Enterococcus alcedinis TaxID=1274384 RepID=A0A917JF16_9ENTE|nr:hypothetical protein [Enterococcus alcedinis]MBP2100919.1 Skp family chaperone for outer membrane proteins [Enterococcus alcedinis]GGI64785.1 hypothetical protein GCM10011482_04390 [Enterococcus alcedinis]
MKEALERIRLAEEQNEQAQKQLLNEIDYYQQEKQNALQEQQTLNQQLRKELMVELESSLLEQERLLERQLQAEAQQVDAKNEEIYLQQKNEMVQKIIKEMRGAYGC